MHRRYPMKIALSLSSLAQTALFGTLFLGLFTRTPSAIAQNSAVPGLPVKRVTLFTSGVSYTERSGSVSGNAEVALTFHTAQINDILKSMVLLDSGGRVQPATFGTRDPISRSLQAFAVDVSENTTLEGLLGRMRGTQVAISEGGKLVAEGSIVGIEKRSTPTTAGASEGAFVSLLTPTGLTAVPLDAGKTVKVLDEHLDHEFRDALALLASATDDQKRQVKLHFAGAGKREVRVGYVMEAPIWKISYRLLLGGENAGGKPYLQGWALVENSTDEDWKGVRLSLVSGRPVSFIQDLYQPLYIPRPVVGPDIVASPVPQTHDDNLLEQAAKRQDVAQAGGPNGANGQDGAPGPSAPSSGDQGRRQARGAARSMLPAGIDGSDLTALSNNNVAIKRYSDDAKGVAAFQALQAQASGMKVAEMFSYNLNSPLNLPRQQAAMIPVIAQAIQLERISLYNADALPGYAMNGLRLHNTTGLHLKGGSVTLFDGATYAGDARMEDVPPGDSRILTYAVDLGLVCSRETPMVNSAITSYSAKQGIITIKHREVTVNKYALKSRADKIKTVLVEQPLDSDAGLIEPAKPTEKTADLYRFAVNVPAGKTVALKVVTSKPVYESTAIINGDTDVLLSYATGGSIPARLKAAIYNVIAKRKRVNELKAAAASRTAEVAGIGSDQERIRKNMGALDKSSALYKRYVTELDQQETKIAALRAEAAKLDAQRQSAENEMKRYVDSINE